MRLVAVLALCPLVLQIPLSAERLTEYEVKAAFLINFAKFIEWPPETLGDGASPILIGVLGDDPFGVDLDRAVRGKTVNGHPLTVNRIRPDEDLTRFHILFVSLSEERRGAEILRRVGTAAVLTVSDIDRFCMAGGVINFVLERNMIRFEINLDVAQRSRLKISSKLLALAAKVHPATD